MMATWPSQRDDRARDGVGRAPVGPWIRISTSTSRHRRRCPDGSASVAWRSTSACHGGIGPRERRDGAWRSIPSALASACAGAALAVAAHTVVACVGPDSASGIDLSPEPCSPGDGISSEDAYGPVLVTSVRSSAGSRCESLPRRPRRGRARRASAATGASSGPHTRMPEDRQSSSRRSHRCDRGGTSPPARTTDGDRMPSTPGTICVRLFATVTLPSEELHPRRRRPSGAYGPSSSRCAQSGSVCYDEARPSW